MDPNIYYHIMELARAVVIYDQFCLRKECPEVTKWTWEYDASPCISCERVGPSYQIDKYPKDCLHKEEIEKLTTITMLKGERRVL